MNNKSNDMEDALWQEFGQYLQSISQNFTDNLQKQYDTCDKKFAMNFNSRMAEFKTLANQHSAMTQHTHDKMNSLISETQDQLDQAENTMRNHRDEVGKVFDSKQGTLRTIMVLSLFANIVVIGLILWSRFS